MLNFYTYSKTLVFIYIIPIFKKLFIHEINDKKF